MPPRRRHPLEHLKDELFPLSARYASREGHWYQRTLILPSDIDGLDPAWTRFLTITASDGRVVFPPQ